MDTRRLFKLFLSRWWLILLVAIIGGTTAYVVTTSRNAEIEEQWQATAPVLILKTSSESDKEYESRLRLAESRARIAVEVQVAEDPGIYQVQASADRGRLEFIAVDPNPAGAETLAEGLRATYLTAEPTDGIAEQLSRNLDDLEVQILALRADRAALVATTPVDPGVAAQLSLMDSQLSSLRQRAASLSLAISFPELDTALDEEGSPRSASELRAKLASVQGTINRLQSEYDSLTAANPDASGSDGSGSLDILVIDQQIRDLESQYVETALTLEDLGGGGSSSVVSNRTEVINITELPTSPIRASALGFVLGAVLASLAVVAVDRLRQPIYGFENDLALPIIATVDPERTGASDTGLWYPRADGRRRTDVQALRAALEGVMGDKPVTIGLSGLDSPVAAVQELAADLAVSIASSGREVLLVDAVFDAPSDLSEYGSTVSTLSGLITYRATPEDARQRLQLVLGGSERVMPELLSLRAGSLDTDPVDAVAGRRFRELLDIAVEFADVAIVAAPGWDHPETEVLAQRLDYLVVVGESGRLAAVDVDTVAAESTAYRAQAAGLVLLRRRRWFGQSISDRWIRSNPSRLDQASESEVAVGVGALSPRRSSVEAAADAANACEEEPHRRSIDPEISMDQQERADSRSEAMDRGTMDR